MKEHEDLNESKFLKDLNTDLAVYGRNPDNALRLLEKINQELCAAIRLKMGAGSDCVYFRSGPVPVLDQTAKDGHKAQCLLCRLLAVIETLQGDAVRQLEKLALVVDSELAGDRVMTENN